MKLTGFTFPGHNVSIRPAPLERPWMDATTDRFAYRCLPLNIANCHGWEVLNPTRVSAIWDGGALISSIKVEHESGDAPAAVSHFGSGVLTFHIPVLFRTPPGYDLMVSGPVNMPKDGIAPLSGVIETDWSPYSFTMNWLFTRPGQRVVFEKGEPVCHLFPVMRGALQTVEPELVPLSTEAELQSLHETWSAERHAFNAGLHTGDEETRRAGWQRDYFRGRNPDGSPGAPDHRSRLRLKPFRVATPGGAGAPSGKVGAAGQGADAPHTETPSG